MFMTLNWEEGKKIWFTSELSDCLLLGYKQTSFSTIVINFITAFTCPLGKRNSNFLGIFFFPSSVFLQIFLLLFVPIEVFQTRRLRSKHAMTKAIGINILGSDVHEQRKSFSEL